MPKRKIPTSLVPPETEDAALAAIREALKRPRYLSEQEAREFLERRARGWVERHEYVATVRRGRIVYREHGKAGADYPVPPYYWRMLVARRDFETQCAKADRELIGVRQAREAHRTKAQATAERIRGLARTIPSGRGQVKAIARAAGVDVRTVRRALSGAT